MDNYISSGCIHNIIIEFDFKVDLLHGVAFNIGSDFALTLENGFGMICITNHTKGGKADERTEG